MLLEGFRVLCKPKTYLLILVCVLGACGKPSHQQATSPTPTPTPDPVASAAEAKVAFASPEALTKALERRWPLSAIRTFCIPERRHNNRYQNLVAYSPRWDGVLYSGELTGFDGITWYASLKEGRADVYSLNVNRGNDHWLLEIGGERTLQAQPYYDPDPNLARFVGYK